MKIGIVGFGYVGNAMFELFNNNYEVYVHDISTITSVPPRQVVDRDGINKCDIAIVCVPTPMNTDGSCDTSQVESTIEWLRTSSILIKSTVSPGTTDRLREQTGKRIVFSPEYCGESTYWTPYAFHRSIAETPFFIFGGDPADTTKMVDLFLKITGPTKRYIQTDAKSAELAKYMSNTFFATKITFCYEFAHICDALGADFNRVRELWLEDPRINPMHTAVFTDNKRPFAGKCLPKDLAGLINASKHAHYHPEFLESVRVSNDRLEKIRTERAKATTKKVA